MQDYVCTVVLSFVWYSLAILLLPPRARLPQSQHHAAIVLGTKYTAEEALEARIINEVCPIDDLQHRAMAAGKRLSGKDGLDRTTLIALKRDLYRDACIALQGVPKYYSNL